MEVWDLNVIKSSVEHVHRAGKNGRIRKCLHVPRCSQGIFSQILPDFKKGKS